MQSIENWGRIWGVKVENAAVTRTMVAVGLSRAFQCEIKPEDMLSPSICGGRLLAACDVPTERMPEELRLLISSTTPQHRIELFPGEGTLDDGLWVYDGLLMYLGCCDGLGVAGADVKHIHRDLSQNKPEEMIGPEWRGRMRVEFSVPRHWSGVGILPVKDTKGGWEWPSVPGEPRETWADLSQVRLALSNGWPISGREAIVWRESRPLDLWARRLARLAMQDHVTLAACYRAIGLQTIGCFHRLGYRDNVQFVPQEEAGSISFEQSFHPVAGGFQVKTREKREDSLRTYEGRPEWSAAIWSRCQLRVTKMMLAEAKASVVAVRGDAVYLDRSRGLEKEPKAGSFRLKQRIPGQMPYPKSWADLKVD